MPNDFTLRWATTADAGSLARAAAAFFTDTFAAVNRPEDMAAYLPTAFSEDQQRRELEDSSNRVLLAIDGAGDLTGYAHLRMGSRPATLEASATRPVEIARFYAGRQWHGRGLGARLMDASLDAAREWRADVVWLGVWEQNPRAIAFYKKQGFNVVGDQWFMLGADRQHDLVMALHLTTQG
jgi:GNAT superfamily N-acetyltransferase